MAAKYGDAFYPVASYFAEPIDGGNIGVESPMGRERGGLQGQQAQDRKNLCPLGHYQHRHASVRQDLR